MASIISLDAHRSAQRDEPQCSGVAQHACEIVIFPGIRYERWEDTTPEPAPSKQGQRKGRKR